MSYYATFIQYTKARYFFVDKPTGSPVEEENIEKIATVKIGELTDEELSEFKSEVMLYKTSPIIELPITTEGLIVLFDFCVGSLDEISQLNFPVGRYFGIYIREGKGDIPLLEIIEPDKEKLPPHLAICLAIANKIRSERTKPASAAADKPVKEKAENKSKKEIKVFSSAEQMTSAFFEIHDKNRKYTAGEIVEWGKTRGQTYSEAAIMKTEGWGMRQEKHKGTIDTLKKVGQVLKDGRREKSDTDEPE